MAFSAFAMDWRTLSFIFFVIKGGFEAKNMHETKQTKKESMLERERKRYIF